MVRQPFINNQSDDRYIEEVNSLAQVQKLFLATIIQPEARSEVGFYPWEPTQAETESYFHTQQEQFSLDTLLGEGELGTRAAALFSHLGQCWQSVAQGEARKQVLFDRFAGVPIAWLEAIAAAAQGAMQQKISLQDKLVSCVQSLLPQWNEEDLQVLARPLAYAMRGSGESPQAFKGVWEELSPVEQARWSLAIAKTALQDIELAD